MMNRSILAALLLAAVLAGWWAWKNSPNSSEGKIEEVGNSSAQRSLRPSLPAPAADPPNPSRSSLDYQRQLNGMRVLIRLGGRNRLKEMLVEWAKVDSDAAFQWAKNLAHEENEFYENELCAEVVKVVAATDPLKAQEMLAACPNLEGGDDVIAAIVRKLGETDPESAWRYLSSIPVDDKVAASWKILGAAMVRHDVQRALKLLEEVSLRGKEAINRNNIDFFLSRILLLEGISKEWARKDLDAALQWAGDLPLEEKKYAFEALCPVWVLSDPQAAFKVLLENEEPNELAMDETFRAWGEKDPASALRFIDGRSWNSTELFVSTVYQQWAKSHPHEALAHAKKRGDSEALGDVSMHVWDQFFPHSLQEAAALIPDMDAPSRASATIGLIDALSLSDPEAAMKLLSGLEDPVVREMAAGGLASLIADEHPDLATDLLKTLKRPTAIEKRTQQIALQWLYRDEATGKKRLLDMGFSEETIDEWNAKIPDILAPPSVGTSFGDR